MTGGVISTAARNPLDAKKRPLATPRLTPERNGEIALSLVAGVNLQMTSEKFGEICAHIPIGEIQTWQRQGFSAVAILFIDSVDTP